MSSRYAFIKCVRPGAQKYEKPSRILRLPDLEKIVRMDSELQWGIDPRGSLPVKNPDGSVVVMNAASGFSFSALGESPFFICYESYEGLAIHAEGHERVHQKAQSFAESLGAQLFVM